MILDATDAILMIFPDLQASIYMEMDKAALVSIGIQVKVSFFKSDDRITASVYMTWILC